MGVEIERKFLVRGESWREGLTGIGMRQGYLSLDPERTVRIRLQDRAAFLTIKGPAIGLTRPEFEYQIPEADARRMLDDLALRPQIDKTRFLVPHEAHVWEVDVFHGDNAGLIVAEIELGTEAESFARPDWLGEEVTGDPRYFNTALLERPWPLWGR